MIINGERALAYVVTIDDIKPIEGYDRVEYARTNGWWVIISKKDNLSVGDKCIYFEIDSKVPQDDERFKFLERSNYKIKTLKMCKVISQGLLMPLSLFPELGDLEVNTDCTNALRVSYYVTEDNFRKKSQKTVDAIQASHNKIAKTKMFKLLSKCKFGRHVISVVFNNDKSDFPAFIKKTDEERVENQPWRAGDGKEYILTEKLDGTSSTYVLERKRFNKYEFYVCSRNIRLFKNQKTYFSSNIYYEMALKYNIEDHLKSYLRDHKKLKWVCVQGETIGPSIQGNPLMVNDNDLYIFNFITSDFGRHPSLEGKRIIEEWGMKWVPIIGVGYTQNTMNELKEFADGKSIINNNALREGIVYRSLDGVDSFKNVSRKFLLSKKE